MSGGGRGRADHGRGRGRGRPLVAIIRENHEIYNHFMLNTLPRILRVLGLDEQEDEQ